jgi:DNA-binding MurR/RpiR family transcriptional regulator
MNKIVLSLKILYPKLGSAEQKVANFVLNSPKQLIPLSISELAKACDTSEATITRFSRKMGYEGYQQLKIAVAQESGSPVRSDISIDDQPFDILEKVCDDIYCSLEKTKKAIDKNSLKIVCKKILASKNVLIFGLGNSASVATDAAHKLLRIGINAHAYTDNHMQAIAAAHSNEDCIAIGISHSGSSKDIVRTLELCRHNGSVTVALTNYGKSPIYRVSDYVLNTIADETNYTILGLSSRISQLAIIDTIYSYLVCNLEDAKESIHLTEEALQSKKY